jgi:hypothetical protein
VRLLGQLLVGLRAVYGSLSLPQRGRAAAWSRWWFFVSRDGGMGAILSTEFLTDARHITLTSRQMELASILQRFDRLNVWSRGDQQTHPMLAGGSSWVGGPPLYRASVPMGGFCPDPLCRPKTCWCWTKP